MSDQTASDRPPETGWLADTPVEDNLLRRFVHSQGTLNAVLASAASGRSQRTDDVFLADAGSPVPYFNQAVLTRPLESDADPVLGEIEDFYAASQRAATLLSIWPTPDLGPRGWSLVGHPAFVVRGPASPPNRGREGVSVKVAASEAEMARAERVYIEGYPLDEASEDPPGSVLPPDLISSALVVRLGLLGNEPVAVGSCHVGHGVVNLCGGTTLPAARRQGVWEALVWARVADAPELPAVAFTSDFSRPGFIRMGFLPITRFTLWSRAGAGRGRTD